LLATTLLGKGIFNGDPYTLGVSGGFAIEDARPILKQADLVVAFGAQLNDYTMDHGNLYHEAKLIQVDVNPAAIGEYHAVDQAIVADAALTAQAISLALGKHETRGWRTPDMAARIAAFDRWRGRDMTERPGRANIRKVVDAIDRLAPTERMICIDIGLFMGPPAAYMTVPAPDAQVFPWQLGRVGVGLSVAAGAALGRPDRLMIGFVGDGGMMAAMNALDTLRGEHIPMLLVVMDDGGFGADRHIFQIHGENTAVADYETPDLVAVAKAFGLRAFKVTSGMDMEQLLRDNDLRRSAVLVHVVMDAEVPAQEMDFAIYKSMVPH
jgi:thiamine pyrophosphate-dependent acetolactate synthase large subunit-like protein